MFSGDRLSTLLGAPPHHWKKCETEQIKHIHRCYKNAYNLKTQEEDELNFQSLEDNEFTLQVGNSLKVNVEEKTHHRTRGKKEGDNDEENGGGDTDSLSEGGEKDEEDYLPADSPLRSKRGDKKAPLNPTFKDFDTFVNSCHFDFWGDRFNLPSEDKLLSETAQTIVANICGTQSRNQLRVRNGHIPLRKKREQITPLALTLHEIKLWAANQLRPSSVYDEDTYKEIRCRVKYLDALAHKEVWGDASHKLFAGMTFLAQNTLFRLFITIKEDLEKAGDYAYRGYCRRSSREKLAKVGDMLKDVILREMKTLSGLIELDQKLEDPKTPRLQPLSLLNSSQAQTFIDFHNFVNVLLYRLCKNPLVKAVLTAEYDNSDVQDALLDLSNWSMANLFCRPSQVDDQPDFLMDRKRETRILPEVYTPAAGELHKRIRDVDPKAPVPFSGKKHVKRMVKAFQTEPAAARVVKMIMKSCAALQELVPSIYAMYQLWVLAGDGGDFTVYDTLRDQVIVVMTDTINRVHHVQQTEKMLLKEIGLLSKAKEDQMKKDALKKKKMYYKPAWVMNLKFIQQNMLPSNTKVFNAAMRQLVDIAKDAHHYNLTTDQLDDKVQNAKKMIEAITGKPAVDEKPKSSARGSAKLDLKPKGKDWLKSDEEAPEGVFGTNNAFSDSRDLDDDDDKVYNPFDGQDSDSDDDN